MFTKSLIALVAASTGMAQLMIQTPASLIECQPVLLSWSGGAGMLGAAFIILQLIGNRAVLPRGNPWWPVLRRCHVRRRSSSMRVADFGI
jgi:hypothetical protein